MNGYQPKGNNEAIKPPNDFKAPTERKSKSSLTVEINADTARLQRKLKAISKHVGALLDELEAIDKAIECPHCGSIDMK